eukprot:319930_1
MAKQLAFTNLLLDDNNEIISSNTNKKDDSQQQAIFSITDGKWKEISDNNSNENIVKNFDLWKIFSSVFLPIGYPSSVTSDYGIFQICDTIQALCSYLRGLLTTRSTLIGIGVGKSTANATSATIQFIFRDLTGLIGSVLFSWKYSYSFGVEIKQWRLFADVINDIALTLELISPLFPSICFVPILCIASVCKAMCGCSAGATRVGIAKHFAKNDNETDIISKEGIQETFVTVLGMIFGLILTSCLNNNEYEFVIIVFTFVTLTIVHVVANYFAVKSLQLNTLNRERLNIIMTHYLKHKNGILTPKEVCNYENVWNVDLFPLNYITNLIFDSEKDKHFKLNLGIKINDVSAMWMEWNLNVFKDNKKYYFDVVEKRKYFDINIAYNVNASDIDFAESFLIYRVIKDWIWMQMKGKKDIVKPDLSLKLLSEKEMMEFRKMLEESAWKIANLRLSLCVMPNRYQNN